MAGRSLERDAARGPAPGWLVPIVAIAIATLIGMLIGVIVTDRTLGDLEFRKPWRQADSAATPSPPESAPASDSSDDITIFSRDESGTLFVQIPGQNSDPVAPAASIESATGGDSTLLDAPWLLAFLVLVLTGLVLVLARHIFGYMAERNRAEEETRQQLIDEGRPYEMVPVRAIIRSGALLETPTLETSLMDAVRSETGAGRKQAVQDLFDKVDDAEILEYIDWRHELERIREPVEPPRLTLASPGTFVWNGKPETIELAYTFDDDQAYELSWAVEPQSTTAPTVMPVANNTRIAVEIRGPGAFVLTATAYGLPRDPHWSFPFVVSATSTSGPSGPAPVTIPYVGAGWGTITLCLFLILTTAVLGLAGSIESSVISGVFLAIAGYLFGRNAGGGNGDEKNAGKA